MRRRFLLAAVLSCLLGGCLPPQVEPHPAQEQVKPHLPRDTAFSVGVTNNAGEVPQGATLVQLRFSGGTSSPNTVVAQRLSTPPVIDGDDADWTQVAGSEVPLDGPGTMVGISRTDWEHEWSVAERDEHPGEVPVYDFEIPSLRIKAAYDDQNVYLVLRWKDATEDRKHGQWLFDGTGWRQSELNEDRAYLAFEIGQSVPLFKEVGCTAGCHIKERMGQSSKEASEFRFEMHSDGPGERVDIWHWQAARSDVFGHADDAYWDEESIKGDGPGSWAVPNQQVLEGGVVMPAFMASAGINASPAFLSLEGGPIAVGARPFNGTGVAAGTTLPGYLLTRPSEARAQVLAKGSWKQGEWTLELSRRRVTGDAHDIQFDP